MVQKLSNVAAIYNLNISGRESDQYPPIYGQNNVAVKSAYSYLYISMGPTFSMRLRCRLTLSKVCFWKPIRRSLFHVCSAIRVFLSIGLATNVSLLVNALLLLNQWRSPTKLHSQQQRSSESPILHRYIINIK